MGYNNHFETGWVLIEHTRLINEAIKQGIQSPESYYNDGKKKGRASREKNICESYEKKTNEVSTVNGFKIGIDKTIANKEINEYEFLKKPSHNAFPNLVKKIRMVGTPKLLYGLKLFKKK